MVLSRRIGLLLAIVLSAASCSTVAPTENGAPDTLPFGRETSVPVTATRRSSTTIASTTTSESTTTTEPTTTTTPCVGPEADELYYVSGVGDKLNVRSAPGTDNPIVGGLDNDTGNWSFTSDCEMTDNGLTWWRLSTGEGWVAAPYMIPQGDSVCRAGKLDPTGASGLSAAKTGEIDGDGRIDKIYTFVRNGELSVGAELGDGGYIETSYVEDNDGGTYGYPENLTNIRAVRPAGRSTDVLLADSSNGNSYMFGYRLCELPLFGGMQTEGPFSFQRLATPELSQRLVCTLEADGTNLYIHRWGTDVGGEELRRIVFNDTYHGASTQSPIEVDRDGRYWAC